MFVLLALSLIYVKFGNLPWVAAMFNGLKPAVIALVIVALHRVTKKALRAPVQGGSQQPRLPACSFLMFRCCW